MAPNEEAAAQWERAADADRRAMEVLAKADVPRELVAFHAQQWVEKLLKAIIALRGEDPPRAHDLTLLLELAGAGSEGCRRLVELARSVAAWASARLRAG